MTGKLGEWVSQKPEEGAVSTIVRLEGCKVSTSQKPSQNKDERSQKISTVKVLEYLGKASAR